MGYVGDMRMVLTYKALKSDEELKATQISQKILSATRESSSLSEEREAKLAELDKDDPNYDADVDAIEDDYKDMLAELAAKDDDLEQQKSNCETKIKLYDGYITAFQQAEQSKIASSHTYGAQQ